MAGLGVQTAPPSICCPPPAFRRTSRLAKRRSGRLLSADGQNVGREQLHQLSKWAKIAFWFALEVARLEQTEAHMRGSRQRGFSPALGAGWSEGARNLPPRCPSSRRCRSRQMPLPSRHRWPPASSSTLVTTAPTFSTVALEQKERDAFFRGETVPRSGSLSRGTCRDEIFQPVVNPALYHCTRWITCDSLNNLLLRLLLQNPSCPRSRSRNFENEI